MVSSRAWKPDFLAGFFLFSWILAWMASSSMKALKDTAARSRRCCSGSNSSSDRIIIEEPEEEDRHQVHHPFHRRIRRCGHLHVHLGIDDR